MLNHLVIQGRLVDTPTFGDTNANTRFANFRIAWSEKYKDKETKCFLECKTFSGTAQFMEKYMNQKGQEIIAEGKLTTEEWTNQDGQKRSKNVLLVASVHFCGKKESSETDTHVTTATPTTPAPAPQPVEIDDGELLF